MKQYALNTVSLEIEREANGFPYRIMSIAFVNNEKMNGRAEINPFCRVVIYLKNYLNIFLSASIMLTNICRNLSISDDAIPLPEL